MGDRAEVLASWRSRLRNPGFFRALMRELHGEATRPDELLSVSNVLAELLGVDREQPGSDSR